MASSQSLRAAKAHLQIGRVDAPVLLVQGTEDIIVDPADAERLQTELAARWLSTDELDQVHRR